MISGKINFKEKSPPRYEYRTFGHNFYEIRKLMEKFTQPIPEDLQVRIFDEVYIVSKNVNDINIKIKNNLLDIKKLINIDNRLERWDSVAKYEFPLNKEIFFKDVLLILKADIPILKIDDFNIKQLLSIAKRHKDLMPISVHKKRHAFLVNYTICEYAEIIIGNEYIYTVSVESTDPDEVMTTVDQLKLNLFENINYIQAIKRIYGLINKPLAN